MKGVHGTVEKLTANSLGARSGHEKEQKQPGTHRGGEDSRRDLVLVEKEARARVERLKCGRRSTGLI